MKVTITDYNRKQWVDACKAIRTVSGQDLRFAYNVIHNLPQTFEVSPVITDAVEYLENKGIILDKTGNKTFDSMVKQEEFLLSICNELHNTMSAKGISRSQLSILLHKDERFIENILKDRHELTLRELSDIAGALNMEPVFRFEEKDR